MMTTVSTGGRRTRLQRMPVVWSVGTLLAITFAATALVLWDKGHQNIIHKTDSFTTKSPKVSFGGLIAVPDEHNQLKLVPTSFDPEEYSENTFSDETCTPHGVHLAQATDIDDDTETLTVTISFFVHRKCRDVRPCVLYGQQENPKQGQACSSVERALHFNYTSDATDGQAWSSDWIYHIRISNIRGGGLQYWYRIVLAANEADDDEEEDKENSISSEEAHDQAFFLRGKSFFGEPSASNRNMAQRQTRYGQRILGHTRRYLFRSPPLKGQPTMLALVGDIGQTENSSITARHIWQAVHQDEHPVTQLMIAGDMPYSHSNPYRWKSFFKIHEPLLRSTLLHVETGNHEIECDTRNLNVFTMYEHFFRVPNRLKPAEMMPISDEYRKTLWDGKCSAPSVFHARYNYGNSFYAYKHGLAKFIMLNTYTDSRPGSPQYHFLQQELQATQRTRTDTPWLIVVFHAPIYNTFIDHQNEANSIRMREHLEPLFFKYQVNFIVSGHVHAYMRTHPVYNDTVVPEAPIYLTLGAGGNEEGHAQGFVNPRKEPWVAKRDISEFGYGKMFLRNATHARFSWVRDDETITMGVHDEVWLENQYKNDLMAA